MGTASRTATLRDSGRQARRRVWGLVHLFSECEPLREAAVVLRGDLELGRESGCSIHLLDDAVSRRHARLWRDGESVWIEDLGSRNGTRVDRRALRAPAAVSAGQVVRVGRSLFLLSQESDRFPASWRSAGGPLVGGPAIEQVREFVVRFGVTAMPILVIGETGTGKELVASEIHRVSARRGPIVPVNCAAVPASVFEAELFGYRRGAFTGATTDKRGLLLEASQGTLFLDEVGELDPENQAKLLRALESGEVRALGATRAERAEVRIVAATNRDLRRLVEAGKFRADLYERLNGVSVFMPPLRERREDVVVLTEHFLRAWGTESGAAVAQSAEACEALLDYRWPGNVRELHWCVRASAHRAHAEGRDRLLLADLPGPVAETDRPVAPDDEVWEKVCEALRNTGGNVARAAKAVDLHRAQIYELLRRHRRKAEDFR